MITGTMLQWYLPFFLLIYLLVTFVLPSWRVYKKTGINPMTFGKDDNAHDFIGRWMKGITALLAAVILLFSFVPGWYSYLLPFWYLEHTGFKITGLTVIHLSLGWIMLAQYQMNNSWRIGIDQQHPTELVTTGLFRISRNPVFVGMLVSVLGMFFILPNAITLLILVASYILIQVQIRLEEDHLNHLHGIAYQQYRKKVRRLV
jgi:protein-S-isoprenylcysteine O-methyltransferase Ste14